MNLLEIMIVVAILVALIAVMVPMLGYVLRMDERAAANRLALTYSLLHDEAVLRNVTFRVAYHLDEAYYQVEVGNTDTLVFDDPDARMEWEQQERNKLDQGGDTAEADFAEIKDRFHAKIELPSSLRFGRVFTPQYGDWVEPNDDEEVDPEDRKVVYSYVFANGFSEHTVVQVVRIRDPEEGFTVEVEPMTGRTYVDSELLEWDERFDFIPEEGPELPD